MRFHTITTSGPSPGITIAGSKEDLQALGLALADAARSNDGRTEEERTFYLNDMEVCGDPWDWINFRIDTDVDGVIERRRKKDKNGLLVAMLFWMAVCVVIGLAAVGVLTFFR